MVSTRRQVLGRGLAHLAHVGMVGIGGLATPFVAPARAAGPRIEIAANRLTYEGRPLRLTGVAMGDPIYVRARRPLSDYDVVATDWRANCVRISVHPGHWRNRPAETEAALARDMTRARAAGLFVILCWHRIGFPGHYDFVPPAEWGFAPDAFIGDMDDARRFWTRMARLYGADPAVLLELWNEPTVSPDYWEATGRDWPLFRAAWEILIDEIRRESDAIVLCTGGYWANDLVGVREAPVRDPRTAYAWHAYPPSGRGTPRTWNAALDGLHEHRPVVVTEWGWCEPGICPEGLIADEAGYGRLLMENTIDAFGLHYTAWCYSVGAVPNLIDREDGTPSTYGRFVRRHLHASARAAAWRRPS